MTIRDIAKIANVSVTTVSKIINKKDESISDETRERVLAVIQENNYAPYRGRLAAQTHLLGVMLPDAVSQDFLSAVVDCSKEHGYGAVVCTSSTAEEEEENAQLLRQHGVNGVLWFKGAFSTDAAADIFAAQDIPTIIIDECGEEADIPLPWGELGVFVGETFSGLEHQRIGCVFGSGRADGQALLAGLNEAMLRMDQTCTREDLFSLEESETDLSVWLQEHTAVLCADEQAVKSVMNMAETLGYRVPNDLSVIMLRHTNASKSWDLSSILLPYGAMGCSAVEQLIAKMQEQTAKGIPFTWQFTLDDHSSIAYPRANGRKKIVVVGTINADTLISVEKYPELGETVSAQGCFSMPGGKGLNQALAVSRLDLDACLIAKVGKDYEGRTISAFLKGSHVILDGVTVAENAPTGKAYIFTQSDAESSISVLKGANALLTEGDIAAQEQLFKGASYCLLQTEIDVSVVECAMDTAHRNGVKTILKPCVVDTLPPQVIRKTDILIPNQKEAAKLLPELRSVEEQASRFYQMGAKNVIITLGSKGCFWFDGTTGKYFPAANFEAVDTTGAADAFIAALSVSLSSGRNMEVSIRYATAAAGLSTMRYGFSAAAAADKTTLELYCAKEGVLL